MAPDRTLMNGMDSSTLPPPAPAAEQAGIAVSMKAGAVQGGRVVGLEIGEVAGDITVGAIQTHIETFVQRLTAAEEADRARKIEARLLAQGVRDFARGLQVQARVVEPLRPDARNPYKGLSAYELGDAGRFFGRGDDVRHFIDHLGQARLTVLHAESGAGKTSLLEAGIAPRLILAGHLPLLLRPYDRNPALAVKQALLPGLADAPGLAGASLREFLRQVTSVLGPATAIVIILDQFEEFITRCAPEDRRAFVRELAECLEDTALNAHWVLALRTEFFGRLAPDFRDRVDPFQNEYYLRQLGPEPARAAIVEPASQVGVTFEEGLVDDLLSELSQGGQIAPPQLQLVCSVLYDALGTGKKVITRALYDDQGRAEGILNNYLKRTLQRRFSGELRSQAYAVLKAMVDSEGQRTPLRTREELARDPAAREVKAEALDSILPELVNSRLVQVREASEDRPERAYELVHDYLAKTIELDQTTRERKAAQELLDRAVADYLKFERKPLLSPDRLAIIEAQYPHLKVSEAADELVKKSRRRLARQRRTVMAGAGFVALLVIAALVSAGLLIATTIARDEAMAQQKAAETRGAQLLQENVEKERAIGQLYERTGTVQLDSYPVGLAWDGTSMWVANTNWSVQQIDPESGQVMQTVPAGFTPEAVAWGGDSLWLGGYPDTILRIQPGGEVPTRTLKVAGIPSRLVWGGERLWALTNTGGGLGDYAVRKIEPETGRIVASFELPDFFEPGGMVWDEKGKSLWVADAGNRAVRRLGSTAPLTITLDASPRALAWDGTSLWTADMEGDTVQRINPDNGAVTCRAKVGNSPAALAWDGASLWVVNRGDNTLQQIDPRSCEVVATAQAGYNAVDLAWDGNDIWIANGGTTVQRVRPEDWAVLATRHVGRLPEALAWDGAGLWINGGGYLQRLGREDDVPSRTFKLPGWPRSFAWDGDSLWIADAWDLAIERVDPANGTVRARVPFGERPPTDAERSNLLLHHPQIALAGGDVWVSNGPGNVVQRLDVRTMTIAEGIPVDAYPSALLAVGNDLWVGSVLSNTVQRVDLATKQVVSTWSLGEPNPSLELDKIRSYPSALAWDGASLWVANRGVGELGTVQRIDPRKATPEKPIQVGSYPEALLWDGEALWVANQDTVQLIDPVGGQVGATMRLGHPGALASDGANLWVADWTGGDLLRQLNARSLRLVAAARLARQRQGGSE